MSDLFWLTDEQIERMRAFFPKSHGRPRVDDRRVLSGIVFVIRNGLRWRDADYGPHKTLYNRWKRWGEAGSWRDDGLFERISQGQLSPTTNQRLGKRARRRRWSVDRRGKRTPVAG